MKVIVTMIILLFLLFVVSNLGNNIEGYENETEKEMDNHMDRIAEEKAIKSGNFILEKESKKKYTLSSDGKTCSLDDNGFLTCLGNHSPSEFSIKESNTNTPKHSNIEDSDCEDDSNYTNVEDSIPNIKININNEDDENENGNGNCQNKAQQEEQYNMAGCGENSSNQEDSLQKCIASYGKKIGDTIPCSNSKQCFPLKKPNDEYICPEDMPHCAGFECGMKWGQCKSTKN